jgi:tetratricopeptide (TPR) repeat protein
MAAAEGRKDFFVSYTGGDHRWAEWIAWVLEEAGHTVVLQAWDFHASENFIANMHRALEETVRTLAILSPAYCTSNYCQREWTAALAKAGQDGADRLLPVRIADFTPPGLFAPIAYLDLVGVEEGEARGQLLAGVRQTRAKPETAPPFPGSYARAVLEKPRFPGALPDVWNLPHRNPHFTGREELIEQLRGTQTAAIHGLGGVGKTQLAIEYAYRFKDDYDVVWWLRAEDPVLLADDCTALARALDLDEKDAREQTIIIAAVRHWLERHGRWLLVYDNAEDPKVIREALPRAGHILITSRNPAWGSIARPLHLSLWPRADSIRFLRERRGEADDRAADRVAEALGDLPLALEQAAAYCEQTGITLTDYADLLERYGAELWREPRDLERTVAAVWELSFSKVEAESPAGAALLQLCAFFAPDNIPLNAICASAARLPEPLRGVAIHPVEFNRAVRALLRYSLAHRNGEVLSIHRLVQAVTRDRLPAKEQEREAERAAILMSHALPGLRGADAYDRLLPHALAAAAHAEERGVALEVVARLFHDAAIYRYLRFFDCDAARAALQRALEIVEKEFGPDHTTVAIGLNNLGIVLKDLGNLDGALDGLQRALEIVEKEFGPDHTTVAIGLNNLGIVLRNRGDLDGARNALQRALGIFVGRNHPDAQVVRDNLAAVEHPVRGIVAETHLFRGFRI